MHKINKVKLKGLKLLLKPNLNIALTMRHNICMEMYSYYSYHFLQYMTVCLGYGVSTELSGNVDVLMSRYVSYSD